MLSILAAATLLLSPLAMTASTPGISDTTNTLAPNVICVTIYEHIDFEGASKEICNSPGLCKTIPREWWAKVSGVSPAEDASGCRFFAGSACDLEELKDVKSPGFGYLGDEWNDRIWSWICY